MMNFNLPTPELVIETTNKIALIDADFIKYIVTYRIHQEVMLEEGKPTPTDVLIEQIGRILEEILMGVKCKAKIFCFSGKTKDTFRSCVAVEKEYKGNRKSKEPMYANMYDDMEFIVQYIMGREIVLMVKEFEADDLLSILQDEDTFIVSKDKDMLQIPGTHYNLKTDEFEVVTEDMAWEFLMAQVLSGDSTDNILGLRGFGPAKIRKLFEEGNTDTRIEQVLQMFIMKLGRRKGLDAFVENYSLVRLLLNRGEYLKEKYSGIFQVRDSLKYVR